MTDRLAEFIRDGFDAMAYGLHAFMSELFYWFLGRVFNIPVSAWD